MSENEKNLTCVVIVFISSLAHTLKKENRKGHAVSFLLQAKPFYAILFPKEIAISIDPQTPITQRKIYRLKSWHNTASD